MPIKQKPIDTRFFNFDEGTLERVSHEYGIPTLDLFFPILTDGHTCSLLETRSATSRKIILGSSKDLGTKFFLKQIPWYCDDHDSVANSHAIQNHLHDRGCPVAAIYKTSEGGSWLEFGREKYVLFEYVHGNRYSSTLPDIQRAAISLGMIHSAGVPKDVSKNHETIEGLAREHIALLGNNGGTQEEMRILHDVTSRALSGLKDGSYSNCPLAVSHGDFSPWNLIFDSRKAAAIVVDFDNVSIEPRVGDIAEAIITFFHTVYKGDTTNLQSFCDAVDKQNALSFMKAYSDIAGSLTASEQKCLAPVGALKVVQLYSLGRIRGDFPDPDTQGIQRDIAMCYDHLETLAPKFSKPLTHGGRSVNLIAPSP